MAFNREYEDWEKGAPELIKTGRSNPFTVPKDYFVSLGEDIEAAVSAERLKEMANTDGFNTPDNYFQTLEKRIKNRLEKEAPGPKVKTLSFGWVKYAAAACITAVVGIGLLLSQRNSDNLTREFHRIPEADIVQYLQINADAGDTPVIIENLSSSNIMIPEVDATHEELEQYINSTTL